MQDNVAPHSDMRDRVFAGAIGGMPIHLFGDSTDDYADWQDIHDILEWRRCDEREFAGFRRQGMSTTNDAARSQTSTVYISNSGVSLPVRIGSTTGNEFSWTVPSVYPPMQYMFGVSQALVPITGIVYSNSVALTNAPVPEETTAAPLPPLAVTSRS